jgi:hypothetical protein
MNKKEMIAKIKEEIKANSEIVRLNKQAYKRNQRKFSKGERPLELLQVYPYNIEDVKTRGYVKLIEGKYYYNYTYGNDTPCNINIESAKCRLTCLHIVYNMLRNNKQHCHNEERNNYYVKYFDKFIQGLLSQVTEEQDVVLQ